VVGNEPFAVILADDLVHAAEKGCIRQMIEAHAEVPTANMAAVMEVPREKTASYGILKLDSSSRHSRGGGNLSHSSAPEVRKIPASAGMTEPRVTTATEKLVKALGLVEKPQPEAAPSTTSIIGRYILQPSIFARLDSQPRGAGGEIQLTDALSPRPGSPDFYGYHFDGTRYDCGEVMGYIEANVALALARPELGKNVRKKIAALLSST
jgi:UTP--glucose-1-phosphate uridylyltransferase